tara:strand:+ start:4386 stop:4712 length:327 start_codon:yes stop_codon:yes gene_type:complete
MKNNIYRGEFHDDDERWYQVWLNGAFFDHEPSLKVINHSPDGFSFGYHGSGCAQLAFGILLEEFGQEAAALHYIDFKDQVVAKLPNDRSWELTSQAISNWMSKRQQTV